jgi:hypothetical protein
MIDALHWLSGIGSAAIDPKKLGETGWMKTFAAAGGYHCRAI